MAADIHPTAIVADGAQIADDAVIGPYCIISSQAVIGSATKLFSHVVVEGCTIVGAGNRILPFAVLGNRTQDMKFKGGNPGVRIGDNNTIREYVTINAATDDGDFTIVGSNCLIMAYAHIAHSCHVGSNVVIANACQIAGHVVIEDMATIEGLVGIVQFLRIGIMAFVGGVSKVTKDIPPYMIAHGDPLKTRGFNRIGMERCGLGKTAQKAVKEAYRILYRQDLPLPEALERIEMQVRQTPEIKLLVNFCRSSKKGISR